MARRYLLSIDGGGIRGIIPLCALAELERVTGRLTREIFHFVAGNSSGAITAAGIAAGIPAEKMLEYYVRLAGRIFVRHPAHALRRVIRGWVYSPEVLRDVLVESAGQSYPWTLNDSPIDLLITATRITDGRHWYFVRDNPANSRRTGHLKIIDCVTASAAVPTYFAPWNIPEDPARQQPGWEPIGALVDGGLAIGGNPIYVACIEAFYYTGQYNPDDTLVVGLGTGRYGPKRQPTWIGPWVRWLLTELLRLPGEYQTDIVRRHFPNVPLYRLDPDLKRLDPTLQHDIDLDDIRAVPWLVEHGARFAARIDWPAILENRGYQAAWRSAE